MTTTAPVRSHEQQLAALEKANGIRIARAAFKRDLTAGKAAAAVEMNEPWLQTMKIATLLLAVPRLGPVGAKRVMLACRISPAKTIGGLSQRQREELAGLLRVREAFTC